MTPTRTIAIVTFVVLVLELTTTRLYAYIGSSHATSTALSIAMLGLALGAFVHLRVPRFRAGAPLLAIALFGFALAAAFGAPLAVLVVLSLVPFTLAGVLVSEAYAARGPGRARATYAIDLFAAAAGCLIAPVLIGPLSPIEIAIALGIACCVLAQRRVVGVVLASAGACLLVAGRLGWLPDGPLELLLRADPQSEKAIVEAKTRPRDIVDSAWSPLGRLDVRRLPGEQRLGVFTDGMSPTYLVSDTAELEATWGAADGAAHPRAPAGARPRARRRRRCERAAREEVWRDRSRCGRGQPRDPERARALDRARRRCLSAARRAAVHRGRAASPHRHRRALRSHRARARADR